MKNNEPMKKLPIGKQEFKGLIEQNCIYVDKTKFLFRHAADVPSSIRV